jgi:type IV pilus assembly protein PilA
MLGKIRKMFKNQKGFTLVELMTVLIILGVILGIGVPKYMKVQAKAKYDADIATLQSIVKAAETYAVSRNDYSAITFQDLADVGIIDAPVKLNNGDPVMTTEITFNQDTGNVDNWTALEDLAGTDPYDTGGGTGT